MPNPVFNLMENTKETETVIDNEVMTVNGTIQLTAAMGLLVMMAAGFVWTKLAGGYTDLGYALTYGGALVGFVLVMIICFAKTTSLIPVYAICEGLFLGGISYTFEAQYPGIVSTAVAGTFAAFFSMLILYKYGIIKCTDKFRSVIFISLVSIFGIYLVDIIGRFFGYAVPLINTSSTVGIGFSIIVVAVAALSLIVGFDSVEKGAMYRRPKKYEWFGAFGLIVTLVWLYLEILNLLAKLQNRR